uniref:Uncharacterized protein n=1 Tax=Anopheles atroparvus TaxID=41427 RepID=A0A182JC33_ANOAO
MGEKTGDATARNLRQRVAFAPTSIAKVDECCESASAFNSPFEPSVRWSITIVIIIIIIIIFTIPSKFDCAQQCAALNRDCNFSNSQEREKKDTRKNNASAGISGTASAR